MNTNNPLQLVVSDYIIDNNVFSILLPRTILLRMLHKLIIMQLQKQLVKQKNCMKDPKKKKRKRNMTINLSHRMNPRKSAKKKMNLNVKERRKPNVFMKLRRPKKKDKE